MKNEELLEVLRLHSLWTQDEGEGARADLRGADLRATDLRGADLQGAHLRGADLRGAHLWGADLWGADLWGAKLNFNSHDLVSELLRADAGGEVEKLKVAGLILLCRHLCWKDFLAMNDPLTDWVLDTLAGYVVDGDDAPAILRERRKTREESV